MAQSFLNIRWCGLNPSQISVSKAPSSSIKFCSIFLKYLEGLFLFKKENIFKNSSLLFSLLSLFKYNYKCSFQYPCVSFNTNIDNLININIFSTVVLEECARSGQVFGELGQEEECCFQLECVQSNHIQG